MSNKNIIGRRVKHVPKGLKESLGLGTITDKGHKETSGSPLYYSVKFDNGEKYSMCVDDLTYVEEKRTMKYISTKTYNQLGPVAYRQWRAESHCRVLHGYALSFHFEFESDTLDARNWVMDYGGLRPLKDLLEEWFDHKLLISEDDPNRKDFEKLQELGLAEITIVEKTGCEGLADWLYEYVNTIFLTSYGEKDRVWCSKVEVRETDSNMAMRVGHREDGDFEDDTSEIEYITDADLSGEVMVTAKATDFNSNDNGC